MQDWFYKIGQVETVKSLQGARVYYDWQCLVHLEDGGIGSTDSLQERRKHTVTMTVMVISYLKFFIKCYLYAAPLYLLCNIIQISRDLACRACPIDIFRGARRLAEKCKELLLIVQCVHSRFPNYDDELAHKLLFTVRGFLHEPMKSTYVSLRFLT